MKKLGGRRIAPGIIVALVIVAAIGVIVFLRVRALDKPRPHWEEDIHKPNVAGSRQTLEVAFIPVTCHLTCPVTDYASRTSTTGTEFDAIRFTEFPPIIEALKSKKILAGFLTVPIAMRMREQGVPIRICCLGHRDGSQLVVRKDLPAKSFGDLRGKTIAIPSPFSNENFFVHKLLRDEGFSPGEFEFVVLPPAEMVAALATKAVDAFIVAEPFCAKAELDGHGRVLYYAKDIWPNFISCCLVVHEDLIKEKPEVVHDLVRGIYESGEWTEQNRLDAAKLVSPYFRQDAELLRYVLTQPADRVTYRNLNPTDEELQKIQDMGMSLGFIKTKVPIDQLIDRRFIPDSVHTLRLDLSRLEELAPGEK
ncbi:MAG TPA: ABC transporter substrate-binding protein [Bacteroidota bacterium]|nr:ABC transporter substrate-binding protein [Bacteroidota bacterium]